MTPIDTPPLMSPSPRSGGPRARLEAFGEAFRAGLKRLGRPVRPMAAPVFQIFDSWATWCAAVLVGSAVVLTSMAYIDPVVQRAQAVITGWPADFFQAITDIGKSGWLLWPTGIALIVILAVMPPVRSFADRVVLALAARLAFLFIAVGGSGLIIAVVKRVIGRARPRYFEEFGSLHFDMTAWKASYASFPSGHSQTAFAIAVAFGCLLPRWRRPLLAIAAVVALSRIAVDAHYFTDIVVGSAWGAWFTVMTRDWFARRGFVFEPVSRRPFPMPRRRIMGAVATLGRRFRP